MGKRSIGNTKKTKELKLGNMQKLNILWTSKDKDTFMYMVALYAGNSIKSAAWDEVNIIVWGGSTRLTGEDIEVQNEL